MKWRGTAGAAANTVRRQLAESEQNTAAIRTVLDAVGRARSSHQGIQATLEAIRDAFGWAYGSYWSLDPTARLLRFAAESGTAGEEFRQVTLSASFAEGVGLSGRAWKARDLVFVDDIGRLSDCVRAPAAVRAGVHSGVCFPLLSDGQVVGTMDFFTTATLTPTPQRLDTLRIAGRIVSQAMESFATEQRQASAAKDATAVAVVLRAVAAARSADQAAQAALDTIRAEFGWAYGSYWPLDTEARALRFGVESGDAGEEFRRVTERATFTEGTGLAGRAWQRRDLVFVPDLAEVSDCVRAPAARAAGVKSGIALPLMVRGQVIGTMDFFTTEILRELPDSRITALRNTALLVAESMQRIDVNARISAAGAELVASIDKAKHNVVTATSVASQAQDMTAAANASVHRLEESSTKIGNVVKVITSIAEQTNLLALNATIEAARAGELGKGFAVVAGEVKELAQSTARATEDVGDLVSAIQSDAVTVVESLAGIRQIVDRINETQATISDALAEQVAVTRNIVGPGTM